MSEAPSQRPAGPDLPLATVRNDHAATRVPDFEETILRYREEPGFGKTVRRNAPPHVRNDGRIAHSEPNAKGLRAISGGDLERLLPPPRGIPDENRPLGYAHLCLRVEDIGAAVWEFGRRGVEVFAGPNVNPTLNRKFIRVKNNSGVPVELVQYL